MSSPLKPVRSSLVQAWKAMSAWEAAQTGANGSELVTEPVAVEQTGEKSMAGLFAKEPTDVESGEANSDVTPDAELQIQAVIDHLFPLPIIPSDQECLTMSGITGVKRSAFIALSAHLLDYVESRPQLKLEDVMGGRFRMRQGVWSAYRKSPDQVLHGRAVFDLVHLSALYVVSVIGTTEDDYESPDANIHLGPGGIRLRIESDPPSAQSDKVRMLEDAGTAAARLLLSLPETDRALMDFYADLVMASSSIGQENRTYPVQGDIIEVEAAEFLHAIGERID